MVHSMFPLSLPLLLFPLSIAVAPEICPTGTITRSCGPTTCDDKKDPVFLKVSGLEIYLCNNDTLIYNPTADNELQEVEYSMIQCNEKTKKWEGIEPDEGNRQYQYKAITEEGKISCRNGKVISCDNTRLEFDDIDNEMDAENPIYTPRIKSYHCANNGYHLYIKKKFTFAVQSGHYLKSEKIECKNGIIMAEFAHLKDAQAIDYRDTITCKKFSCDATLDYSLSYLNVLKIDTKCIPSEGCEPPDFFNEQLPCGDKGHEMTVVQKKDSDRNEILADWVKDHYIECRDGNKLFFTDIRGEKKPIDETYRVVCKMPTDCEPLMSIGSEFGCDNRYDCYNISETSIPFHHLSKFDGNCFKGHVLKMIPKKETGFLIELEFVECRYGKWTAHLLPNSISNSKRSDLGQTNSLHIDPSTNFVCKRRVDYAQCDPPLSLCPLNIGEGFCEEVTSDGLTLSCPSEMNLVEYIHYKDGRMEVKRLKGLVCDKGSGQWTDEESPLHILWQSQERKSYAVCAKVDYCKDIIMPKSSCDGRPKCEPIILKQMYWTRYECPPFYDMKLQEGSVETDARIVNAYFCARSKWSVEYSEVGKSGMERKAKHLTKDDNVFCQEEEGKKEGKLDGPLWGRDSSSACLPTRLDTICPPMQYQCEQVVRDVMEWKCRDDKKQQLWYIEYTKQGEKPEKLESLKCREKYWRAYTDRKMEIIPSPHSNFFCLPSSQINGESNDGKYEIIKNKREKETKKEDWEIPIVEIIVLCFSATVFIASFIITVYGKRKWKQMSEKEQEEALS